MARPRRPAPIRLGKSPGITARAMRGPRGPDDPRWYWQARFTLSGQRLEPVLGWLTREQAQRAAAALLAEGLPVPEPPPEVRTWCELCRLWGREQDGRAESGQIRDRTLVAYRATVRRLTGVGGKAKGSDFGDVLLEQLRQEDLTRYRDRSGYHSSTVALDLRVASEIWRWGRARGLAPARDFPAVAVRVTPLRAKPTPSAGDIAAVVAWLELEAPPWVALAVRLLACGPRRGEVGTLTWDRVHLDEGWVEVHGKTGAREVSIVDPRTLAALRRAHLAAGSPRSGRVLGVSMRSAEDVGRFIHAACDALSLPHWTPHGARRLVDDLLLEGGADPGVLVAHQGHSVAMAVELYRTVGRDHARRVIARAGVGVLPEGGVVQLRRGGDEDPK